MQLWGRERTREEGQGDVACCSRLAVPVSPGGY